MLENGIDMFLWIGANVDPSHVQNLFGVPNVQQLNVEKVFILEIIIGTDVFFVKYLFNSSASFLK
jgi:hypothetical protein